MWQHFVYLNLYFESVWVYGDMVFYIMAKKNVRFWLAGRFQLILYNLFAHIKHLHCQIGNLLQRVYMVEILA